jgi:hypothetical protein
VTNPTPAAWPARDKERDKLLAWNEAARQFVGELNPQGCHNCGAVGAAAPCPRCQLPTCDRCMIGRLDLCAACVIDAQRASFAEVMT